MSRTRYLQSSILADVNDKKMVFIGGPRQVGKTTLARRTGTASFTHAQYLNWDNRDDRRAILDRRFDAQADLIVFDEIHKYKPWKNYLKGIHDTADDRFRIIVTGSARLDLYRRRSDSLMGRYHYHRLHPFSVAEVIGQTFSGAPFSELMIPKGSRALTETFRSLLTFGGFPEPFLKQDARTLRRWQNERMERLVREDIRDVESVRDLSAIQTLVELLPSKVGSLFSLNGLREDLSVAHKTVALWTDILERFYYHFRISPFATTVIKSLRKEPKLYLWDWSEVPSPSARLENIVASHLLKFVHFLVDSEGHKAELFYLRDTQGREVDFLVAINRKPWFAVEVKQSDEAPSPHLRYMRDRLKIPFTYQVVETPGVDAMRDDIRVVSADVFLHALV